MIMFHAKIEYIPGESAPDEYDPEFERIPPDEFVVTRNKDGSVLSRYGDLVWDRTPYAPSGRTFKLNFQFWDDGALGLNVPRKQLVDEMHWLMFILIYLRPGSGLSNSSFGCYSKLLRTIAKHCEGKNLCIKNVLSDSNLSLEYLEFKDHAREFAALVALLRQLGPEVVGFETTNKETIEALRKISNNYRNTLKQHPPMPSRIYSLILGTLSAEISEIEQYIERLISLANECHADPLTGMPRHQQLTKGKRLGLGSTERRSDFFELLQKHGLVEFWIGKGYTESRQGLTNALIMTQLVISLQIQAYTGMRINEVENLPHHCLDEIDRSGTTHYVVKGRVTKLTKGKIKQVQWVTSRSGYEAIRLAQRISLLIYMARGVTPKSGVDKTNNFYLFVSPTYLWGGVRGERNLPASLKLYIRVKGLRDRIQPIIEEDDLRELKQIDPHRDWSAEEKFYLGRPWTFTTHQMRRSLALYAQRSGLVSLPSLKRQMQHITLEMSLYYGRGSAFASDFIGTRSGEKHFGEEWQETQPVSQYLAYAANVLQADESELFGGHMHWIKMRLKNNSSELMVDRLNTLQRFKKGELAYKPTPIGGCVNPGPCEKNPIDILHVDCVAENCRHLVGNLKKTERIILIKSREIEMMKKSNLTLPEFFHEESELKKLVAGYEKVKMESETTKVNNE